MKLKCVQGHILDSSAADVKLIEPGEVGQLRYHKFLEHDECYIQWLNGQAGVYGIEEAVKVTDLRRREIRNVLRRKYPWMYLYDAKASLVAVGENNPESSEIPHLTYLEMRQQGEQRGGYIMQKDDGYLSAFVLHDYKVPQ